MQAFNGTSAIHPSFVFISFNSYFGEMKKIKNYIKNTPFTSAPGPLYQNEVKSSAFDMEMIFHSHANKTHFHKKGCALRLILKVRVFGTWKWPIELILST